MRRGSDGRRKRKTTRESPPIFGRLIYRSVTFSYRSEQSGSVNPEWVEVVLDAIMRVRMQPTNAVGRVRMTSPASFVSDVTPIYDNILAGLVLQLAKFTPVQNTALLDIFANAF